MAKARVANRERERDRETERPSALARVNGILRATRGEGKGRFTKLTPAEASELVKKYNRYFRTGVSTFFPILPLAFSLSIPLSLALSFVVCVHTESRFSSLETHTNTHTAKTNSPSLSYHQQWRRRLICFTRVSEFNIFH